MSKSATVLFVFSHHFHEQGRERLDPILLALALDLPVRLLFTGAGVTHLGPVAHLPSRSRPWTAALASLPMYGLESAGVCAWSARQYNIDLEEAVMPTTALSPEAVAAYIRASRWCL